MIGIVLALFLGFAQDRDPTEELRREELLLRLGSLADAGKQGALARAVWRELRGPRIDPVTFDLCLRAAGPARWGPELRGFVAAWDGACAGEAPAPGPLLFRARLEWTEAPSESCRRLLESAAAQFPKEPGLLWYLGRARLKSADYSGAARALESMGSATGVGFDPDDYHRMLALSYGKTGRSGPALEQLRGIEEDRFGTAELAALARASGLPEEAARLYRLASEADPERIALRIALIGVLRESGDAPGALAERRHLLGVGTQASAERLEDYYLHLPAEGRIEEMTSSLRDSIADPDPRIALKEFDRLGDRVPADDRAAVAARWGLSTPDPGAWLVLGRMREVWGGHLDLALEALAKGEKRFPAEPCFPYAQVETLRKLGRFADLAAAWGRVVALDPRAERAGPLPLPAIDVAIRGLGGQKEVAGALRLGVLVLSQSTLEDSGRTEIKAAIRSVLETTGAGFWDAVRQLPLPRGGPQIETSVRAQISRLSDDRFAVRSEAASELRKAGLAALPALLEHLEDPDADLRSHARDLIRSILTE